MKVVLLGTDRSVMTAADVPSLPESHFALTAQPAVAAPGAEVTLRYRVRNASAAPSPPARVIFHLSPDIQTPEHVEFALPEIAPGAEGVLELRVRLRSPLENGARVGFQAALLVGDDEPLGSNRCWVSITSRARLDGPASVTRLVPGRMPGEIMVEAAIANDGDARATGITLVLPSPIGTRALDETPLPAFSIDVLEAGDSVNFSYPAILQKPGGATLRIDGAYLRDTGGPIAMLAPSDPFLLEPLLAAPSVSSHADGRRRRVAIAMQNSGWAALDDALVEITWPAAFRCAEGSFERNGIVQTKPSIRRTGCAFRISHLPAQEAATISFDLFATAENNGGDVTVRIISGAHVFEASATLAPQSRRAITLRVAGQPDGPADCGERVSLAFDIINDGDGPRTVTLETSIPSAVLRHDGKVRRTSDTLRLTPGIPQRVFLDVTVADDIVDGATIACGLSVFDRGACVAQATGTVVARHRVWLNSNTWLVTDDGIASISLTNRGTTTARNAVVVFDAEGATFELGDIPALHTRKVPIAGIDPGAAARGGIVTFSGTGSTRLAAVPIAAQASNTVTASFDAPHSAHAGTGIPVSLALWCEDAAEQLTVHAVACDGVRIVTGSTRVNEHAIIDSSLGSVLASVDGLAMHAVPAKTSLTVNWSVIVDSRIEADRTIVVRATVGADGHVGQIESEPITVFARRAFAAPAHALPFHIDGIAIDAPQRSVPPHVDVEPTTWDEANATFDPSVTFEPTGLAELRQTGEDISASPLRLIVHLTPDRSASIARLLRGALMPGLISHVFALRALFPDAAGSADPAITEALARERDALRSVLDRLYVKMRIPGYDVTAADCEDTTARRSLAALLGAVADSRGDDWTPTGHPALSTTVDAPAAQTLLDALNGADIGSPIALYAVASLLPRTCDDVPALTGILEHYVVLLQEAFARTLHLGSGEFDAVLAHHTDPGLDAARDRLILSLDAPMAVPA
jgi:hypothetical protein